MKAEMAAAHDPQPRSPPISNNKRKLSDTNNAAVLQNSAYFKIRALARQLRPLFIQVLHTPEFRNCKAAQEIKLQMRILLNLYEQMIDEICQEGKQSNLFQPKQSMDKSTGKVPQVPLFTSGKKLDDNGQSRESYIVGGSAVGLNFITFLGSKPVYYGASKESLQNRKRRRYQ